MSNRAPLNREAGRLLRDLTPTMSAYREKLAEVSALRRRLDEEDDDTTRDAYVRTRAEADQLGATIDKTLDIIERHAHGLGNSHEATWEDDDQAGFLGAA